jgi:hypothetical protein
MTVLEGGMTVGRSRYPKVDLSPHLNDRFALLKAVDKIEKLYDKRGKPIGKAIQMPAMPIKTPPIKSSDLAEIRRMKDRCHMCDKLTCVCVVDAKDEYLDKMNRLFLQSRTKSRQIELKLKARVKTTSTTPVRPKKWLKLKIPSKESELNLYSPPHMRGLHNSSESLASSVTPGYKQVRLEVTVTEGSRQEDRQ